MKKPVLGIGLCLIAVFLMDPKTKEWLAKLGGGKFKPNDCRTSVERLEKVIPKDLKLECEEWTLVIRKDATSFTAEGEDIKQVLYRTMANDLINISKAANPETLTNIKVIYYKIGAKGISIWGMTTGADIVPLANFKDKNFIMEHLKATVKVKEVTE